MSNQDNWRFCNKCHALWWNGSDRKGVCPVDGAEHDGANSWNFDLQANVGNPPGTQDNWRFCNKCFVLWWNGASQKGPCAAGGDHDPTNSWDFAVTGAPDPPINI